MNTTTAAPATAGIKAQPVLRSVHLTLQAKGGVGKSFLALMLAQFLRERSGGKVVVLDTDPVTPTLSAFKALGVQTIQLMMDPEGTGQLQFSKEGFDTMMEVILGDPEASFVIDSGSSSFIPLLEYLVANDIFPYLADAGLRPVIHSSIVGGDGLVETLNGLRTVARALPLEAQLVVWRNAWRGPVRAPDGREIENLAIYEEIRDRLTALLTLPTYKDELFGADVQVMLQRRLTFSEVDTSSDFRIMSKARLRQIKMKIFEQIAMVA